MCKIKYREMCLYFENKPTERAETRITQTREGRARSGVSALDRLPAVSTATAGLYAAPGAAGAESPPFLGHRSWSGPFPPADRAEGDAEKRAAAPAASGPLR